MSSAVPLSARLEPLVQTVDVGRTANLSCRVAGHPVHGVQWTLNGRPLAKGNPRLTLLSRDLLQVSPVQREDRGMYQCLAYNQRDSAQGTAQLVIGGGLTFPQATTCKACVLIILQSFSGPYDADRVRAQLRLRSDGTRFR